MRKIIYGVCFQLVLKYAVLGGQSLLHKSSFFGIPQLKNNFYVSL